jgi:hypothetical protein
MRGLEKGVNPDELDARYVFREGLARANYTHRDWSSEELLGIGIKAFNAWVTGANDDFTFGLRKNEKYPRSPPPQRPCRCRRSSPKRNTGRSRKRRRRSSSTRSRRTPRTTCSAAEV